MKFYNIYNQDKKIFNKIKKKFNNLFVKNDFILGGEVNKFEKKFSQYCNSKFSVGCANGTDAIYLAIKSLQLPEKSEIIVPSMTYCSTAFSVINSGHVPVLVDIKRNKSTLDINSLKEKISNKTKAIILVHLYGQPCEITEIKKIIKKRKIYIIEDAAQAHGAYDCSSCKNKYKKKCCKNGPKIGSLGDVACFSFYPGKNLGAYGDGGAVCTNNLKIYKKIKLIRNLGSKKKYFHEVVGINSRLDTIQSIILNEKIKYLDKYNEKRKKIASIYNQKIKNSKNIEKLKYSKGCVYHQYVIKVKNTKKFQLYLNKKNIPFARHYPIPIHKLKALKNIYKNFSFPNSEDLAKKCISLPIDPLLKIRDINRICKAINEFNI